MPLYASISMSLYLYISVQLYAGVCRCVSICTFLGTHTEAGICRDGARCRHICGYVQIYGWLYTDTHMYVYVQVYTDRQTGPHSFLVVCTGNPLEGEAKRGWLPGTIKRLFNRLNVCAFICVYKTYYVDRYCRIWIYRDAGKCV